MMFLKNLALGKKLALGFLLCLTLASGITVVALNGMGTMARASDVITEKSVLKLHATGEIISCFKQFRTLGYRHLLAPNAEGKRKTEGVWKEYD